MPKYNESIISGETWRRSPQVNCYNNYNSNPVITFDEEDIILLNNGQFAFSRLPSKLVQEFSTENSSTSFQLRNPETEEYIDAYSTYKEVFVLLYSLYFHLATERDRGPKPYPSWVWDSEVNKWAAPVPKPEDGLNYKWDEESKSWITFEV